MHFILNCFNISIQNGKIVCFIYRSIMSQGRMCVGALKPHHSASMSAFVFMTVVVMPLHWNWEREARARANTHTPDHSKLGFKPIVNVNPLTMGIGFSISNEWAVLNAISSDDRAQCTIFGLFWMIREIFEFSIRFGRNRTLEINHSHAQQLCI